MKDLAKLILQKLFGFANYLFVFSLFKIKTLRLDKNENDFLHFLKIIPQQSTIFDIGANIGIMSVYLAKNFPYSTIYSFEPMPENITALKRVLKYYKLSNVQVMECALGDKQGELEMVMPVWKNVKYQGLSHAVHESFISNNDGLRYTVPMNMLDEMTEFKNLKHPLGGIKIDVENFEYYVLKGGENLLRTYKPIVYAELWDTINRKKCFDLMKGLGYKIKILKRKALIDFDPEKHARQNFFFVNK